MKIPVVSRILKKAAAGRLLQAALAGVSITIALLFFMQFLISTGEDVYTDSKRFDFCWMCLELPNQEPEALQTIIDQEMPARPETVPVFTVVPEISGEEFTGVRYEPPPPRVDIDPLNLDRLTDAPLTNVFRVAPQYPLPALARGIEGYVIVRYDVSASGLVSDAQIVESSNEMFDAAVVSAVRKFRYQPRTVDGEPRETKGLERMFRFEIEKKEGK